MIPRGRSASGRRAPSTAVRSTRCTPTPSSSATPGRDEHLDSLTIQTLATRAYRAANRLLVGKAHRVRRVGPAPAGHRRGQDQHERHPLVRDPSRVEGTGAAGAPRSEGPGASARAGLPGQVRAPGTAQARGAATAFTPSWCARGRRTRSRATRWAAGSSGWIWVPPRSRWRPCRPRCSSRSALRWLPIHEPCVGWIGKLDRQRRANNPANYDERGRVKRGKQRWKVSKRQRKVQARRREVYRKLAATRKRSHGQLAHRVLGMGSAFHLEHLSYRAWQKTYGKSVQRCAPGMFVERLSRLAAFAGGTVVSINAARARLSQTCHCSRVKKKARSQRWHVCPCGTSAQRDLFSAYLARFVHPETSLQGAGSGARGLAGVGAHPCRRRTSRPSETNPACGRRLPAAFGRPPVGQSETRVGGSKGRQSILSSAEV